MTVDNLDMAIHHRKLREIRALVEAEHGIIVSSYSKLSLRSWDIDPVAAIPV